VRGTSAVVGRLSMDHRLQVIQQWLGLARDLLTAVAVPITAWIAIRGLTTWRRQTRANVNIEVGRAVLEAVYKVRDAIENVRNPLILPGETVAARKELGLRLNRRLTMCVRGAKPRSGKSATDMFSKQCRTWRREQFKPKHCGVPRVGGQSCLSRL